MVFVRFLVGSWWVFRWFFGRFLVASGGFLGFWVVLGGFW